MRYSREDSQQRIKSGGNQSANEGMIIIGTDRRLQRHVQATTFDEPAHAR